MMNQLFYTLAFLCWSGMVYRLRDLKHVPNSPTLRGTCLTLGFLGLAFLILANSSRPLLDQLIGVEGIARWLGNSCTLAAGCSIQTVLAHFTRARPAASPDSRWRVALLLGAVLSMGVLLLSTQAPDHEDFINVHARKGPILAYLLIYLSYLGFVLADALRLSWRYSPWASTAALRLGLRLIAAGSGIGLLYCLYKTIFAVSRFRDLPTLGPEGVIGPALGLAAALLIVTGLTVGAWGADLADLLHRRRSYRRLKPLWQPLIQALPHIALPAHGHDSAGKLYRRIIEIRDAQLALAPYRDALIARQAHHAALAQGLTGQDLHAAIEGTLLAAALHAHHTGRHPEHPLTEPATQQPAPDPASETAWLEKVAAAFTSPLIPLPHQPTPPHRAESNTCPT